MRCPTPYLVLMFTVITVLFNHGLAMSQESDWPSYGHDAGGSHYSPLSQINRDNVKQLKPVWTYRTGHIAAESKAAETLQFEATPIMVDETLYLSTPFNRVIALDPQTGTE